MSKTITDSSKRVSKRHRKTTKKFGIDEWTQVADSCSQRSDNSDNDCQELTQIADQKRPNLRSKQSLNGNESKQTSNGLQTNTSSKLSPNKRHFKELIELSVNSINRRSLRSEDNKSVLKSVSKSPKNKPKIESNYESLKQKKKCLVKTKPFNHLKDCLDLALKRLNSNAIPDSLPCRESQFNDIFNYVESKLIEGIGGCMYISGVPGTGKTATVYEMKRRLESNDNYPAFKFIEVNGLKLSDPFQSYVQILYELTGEKRSSYQAADTLNDRFSNCDENNEFVVLFVDELDLLRTQKQNILYHLFDWPTRPNSKLIVLAVANSMDLPEKLMINRVSSRLGLTRLSFHPYSYRELEAIITSRLKGLEEVFDCDALQLICRKVAAVSGDARRALDICRMSVEMTQMSNERTVSMKSVDSALKEMFNSLKLVRIRRATLHEKVFLQSIVQEFRISGVEESNFIDIYKHHSEMCRFEGHYIPSTVELEKIAYNLHSNRLIIIENSESHLYKRLRLNVSVDDINFALKM